MKNKRITNPAIIHIIALCIILNIPAIVSSYTDMICNNFFVSTTTEISPKANDIVWKFKLVNGVLYKRQYDYTRNQWIGDWIRV